MHGNEISYVPRRRLKNLMLVIDRNKKIKNSNIYHTMYGDYDSYDGYYYDDLLDDCGY
jgi:hypothetical protein